MITCLVGVLVFQLLSVVAEGISYIFCVIKLFISYDIMFFILVVMVGKTEFILWRM